MNIKSMSSIFPVIQSFAFLHCVTLIPWTIVFLILNHIGIRLYIIKDKSQCRAIQKSLDGLWTHTKKHDSGGYGFSIGRYYIVFLDHNEAECWMITTNKCFQSLTRSTIGDNTIMFNKTNVSDAAPEQDENHITVFETIGTYQCRCYLPRTVRMCGLVPNQEQTPVLDKIVELYETQNKHAVVMIHGGVNRGKSITGLLLAIRLQCSYSNTLRPWQPGECLHDFYADVQPSHEKPVVVVFDEFDIVIDRIHKGIAPHQKMPISIQDKSGWNRMLDEIQWGLYPFLIVILISNKPPVHFESLDSSYIRSQRVDHIFAME